MNKKVFKLLILSALLAACVGFTQAHAIVHGITGTTFDLSVKAGQISTPDGGSIYMWGYAKDPNQMQYPGPTLIVDEDVAITINLTNTLAVPVSMVFPGQTGVLAAGGSPGLLTSEADPKNQDQPHQLGKQQRKEIPEKRHGTRIPTDQPSFPDNA